MTLEALTPAYTGPWHSGCAACALQDRGIPISGGTRPTSRMGFRRKVGKPCRASRTRSPQVGRRPVEHPAFRGRRPDPKCGAVREPMAHMDRRPVEHAGFAAEGSIGVRGPSPRSKQSSPTVNKGCEGCHWQPNRNKWSPSPGGESEGDHTVRPWGGRPVPFYSKAYPARRRACRRWSDQPVKELQHIWVHSEQTFRRILCRYRIFLAGRSWRGWPQGRTGPRGPCAAGEAARHAGAPNG
jgi:hypothetical protein